MNCTNCNTTIIARADGCLACSCDFLDIDPLGEVPEAWELDDETLARVTSPPEYDNER